MSRDKAVLVHSVDDPWMKVLFPFNQVLVDSLKETIPSFARKWNGTDKSWSILEPYKDQLVFLLEDWYEVDERTAAPKVIYPDDMSKVLAEEVLDLRNQRTSLQEELTQVHRTIGILRRENERLKTEGTAQTFTYGQRQHQSAPLQLNSGQSIDFLFKSLPATQHLALYKHLALALHPDSGGSNEMMTALNKVWDRYKHF